MKTEEQKGTELLARESAQWLLAQEAENKGGQAVTYGGKKLNNMESLLVGLMLAAGQGNTQAATTLLTLGGVIGKKDGQNTEEGKRKREERRKKVEKQVNQKASELRKALGIDGGKNEDKKVQMNALVRLTAQNVLLAERANLDALSCEELVHIEYSREGAERTTANPILNIAMQATAKAQDGLNDLGLNERQQMKREDADESEMAAFEELMNRLNSDTDD